ncbi:urease subunit gamma/beta [Saccharopolyspora erythraea NRRL 2338]|uniref:urease n=1 Tax=Saccharopolyspora erythraea TaxID=1836 RepID=A0ABN1CE87_SACER|nr:urease subunit gamma [Saccharopolyspora erythraea]EQD81943.1 urea amidohydrolase [Saccharopolyspora erythraea D]PFG96479.1 urease subunit gamma/beta [Saccharopolyspora erythraea NRRL 2338]QRK92973.1 urease subunit gamma [Saccharopolyspora erythraea]
MHLTPREQERLTLFTAAELARRRLARGSRLGSAEAIALVCDEVLEMAWDGVGIDEVVAMAKEVVRPDQVLPGVAASAPRVQVEALFPHGSSLVHVDEPFGPAQPDDAGAVRVASGEVVLAPGRERKHLEVRNGGARAIWLSSHFPLEQANPALEMDRAAAAGYRLDVPAGTSLEFPPGAARTVSVVARGGAR